MKKLMNNVESDDIVCSEEAVTSSGGSFQQNFNINIHDGKGFYETGVSNTFWSSLIIKAKIFQPQNGVWSIIIRDKVNRNLVVYENHHVVHDKEISFNYKTGFKTNLLIEATSSQSKDAILSGEISIRY